MILQIRIGLNKIMIASLQMKTKLTNEKWKY